MNMVRLCCVGLTALGMSACNPESEGDLVFKFHFERRESVSTTRVAEAMPEDTQAKILSFVACLPHIELMADPFTPVGTD